MGGEAIKVHGSVLSPAVLRVFACLYEKDLSSAEYVPVNMATGDHKKEPFLTLNVSYFFLPVTAAIKDYYN